MAITGTIPKQVKKAFIDTWLPATEPVWKVCLLDSGFTYDHATDITYDDVSSDEIAGTGYTAEGEILTGRVTGYVDTYDCYIDADNTAWTTATFADVRYIVVYETAGKKIRVIYDLGTTYSVTSGTFTIQWNGGGLIKIS